MARNVNEKCSWQSKMAADSHFEKITCFDRKIFILVYIEFPCNDLYIRGIHHAVFCEFVHTNLFKQIFSSNFFNSCFWPKTISKQRYFTLPGKGIGSLKPTWLSLTIYDYMHSDQCTYGAYFCYTVYDRCVSVQSKTTF